MAVNQLELHSNETRRVAKASELYLVVSAIAVMAFSAATANVPTKISVIPSTTHTSADQTTDRMLSAVDEETACVVSAIAIPVRTKKKSSAEHSVNATTSRATEITEFCAPGLTVVSANVEHADVTPDGAEMLANAAAQSKLAKHQTVKSVRVMESATAVGASAKLKTT